MSSDTPPKCEVFKFLRNLLACSHTHLQCSGHSELVPEPAIKEEKDQHIQCK